MISSWRFLILRNKFQYLPHYCNSMPVIGVAIAAPASTQSPMIGVSQQNANSINHHQFEQRIGNEVQIQLSHGAIKAVNDLLAPVNFRLIQLVCRAMKMAINIGRYCVHASKRIFLQCGFGVSLYNALCSFSITFQRVEKAYHYFLPEE